MKRLKSNLVVSPEHSYIREEISRNRPLELGRLTRHNLQTTHTQWNPSHHRKT
jgi:hypothetical protein